VIESLSLNNLMQMFVTGPLSVFTKADILDIMSLLLTIVIWGLAIGIMIHYGGDWNSFIWYIVNEIIVGIGLIFFIVPGVILWIIWAKRAGITTAALGILGVIGAAIGSSFGYESDGLLA